MNHDARIRQRKTLALGACGQQEGAHAGGHAGAQGRDVGLDELHGVKNRHARIHRTAGRVDIERDVLVGVFRFQKQQLRHHQVGGHVIDRTNQKNDALFQQTRVDVIGTLTAARLLDHHRHHAQTLRVEAGLAETCMRLRRITRGSHWSPLENEITVSVS